MSKKITLQDNTEVIADTIVCDVNFLNQEISTICKYCGATIKIHEEEHYDYEDRDTWISRNIYCPNQCDGVVAEYEHQQEIEKAIEQIDAKYYDRLKTTYNPTKVYFRETQNYMNKINKEHEKKMESINEEVVRIIDRELEKARIKVRKRDE